MSDDTDTIIQQLSGAVLTVTLNRPDLHNALSPAIVAALTGLFADLPRRADVRVVVLTGRGRSFCAGADLAAMRAAADFTCLLYTSPSPRDS